VAKKIPGPTTRGPRILSQSLFTVFKTFQKATVPNEVGEDLFGSASLAARFGLWRATVSGKIIEKLKTDTVRLQGHDKYKDAIAKVLSANQNVARLYEQRGITREDFDRAIVNFRQWLLEANWSANAMSQVEVFLRRC
jgi:hypothetical protein